MKYWHSGNPERDPAQLGWSLSPARCLLCIPIVLWDGWSGLVAHNCQEKLVLLPCLLWLCIPMLSPAWGLVRVQPLGGLVQHEQLWERKPSKEGWKHAAGTGSWVRPLAGAVYGGSALLGSLTLLISLTSELPLQKYSMGRLKASFWRHELTQSSDRPSPNTWNILIFFSLAAFF